MEIKIRAYNKVKKYLYKVKRIEFNTALDRIDEISTGADWFNGDKLNNIVVSMYTGFKDSKGDDIYEGDILSDWVETDEGLKESSQQVFWNHHTGSWYLDNSFEQDKTFSSELWLELNNYQYEIISNIYEKKMKK